MPEIKDLVKDIYALFEGTPPELDNNRVEAFGQRLATHVTNRLAEERGRPRLRISNLGLPDRKLWYTINTPELAEPLPPQAKIKFLFGDILEELLLFLAEQAGHEVSEAQKELDLFGVKGHKDATIDGVLVDCKSASSFSFNKFRSGLRPEEDSFGYLTQLDGYLHADDTDVGAFLAIDKTLGHITLDVHGKTDTDYEEVVRRKKEVLNSPKPPPRCYSDIQEGKSGNRKLDVVCSYCPFKRTCWPGLRTFLYFKGPVYLTHVERTPDVDEV